MIKNFSEPLKLGISNSVRASDHSILSYCLNSNISVLVLTF